MRWAKKQVVRNTEAPAAAGTLATYANLLQDFSVAIYCPALQFMNRAILERVLVTSERGIRPEYRDRDALGIPTKFVTLPGCLNKSLKMNSIFDTISFYYLLQQLTNYQKNI